MTAMAPASADEIESGYRGLRVSAEEYFALPDDGNRYELIDGVVIMSPSATPWHQLVALSVLRQLAEHVERTKTGVVLYETDVRLPSARGGGDLVYRPEIIFLAAERARGIKHRIDVVPDLVVEVISPDSRNLDSKTKYGDYEKAGVREYWLIDPERERMSFFGLEGGKFVELPASREFFESPAVAGFRLELGKVRAAFRML